MKIKNIYALDTPFKEYYNNLLRYIREESYLPNEVKHFILEKDFFNINPPYYLYYPRLFCNGESELKDDFIDNLSIAGFLLYKSSLIKDDIIDKNHLNIKEYYIAGSLQEEAIKILTRIFHNNPSFWSNWEIRKKELNEGYELDKSLKSISSFDEYVHLCDLRSATGKVAIDCINLYYHDNNGAFDNIYKSHKYFYVAFQILDDIEDVIEDRKNNQFNIAFHELKIELSKREILLSDISIENLKKYLHLTGVSNTLREKALYFLGEAEIIAKKRNLDLWLSEIQRLYNTVVSHILNTEGYIKYISRDLSNENYDSGLSTIDKAIKYIEKKQNVDGSWNEILNSSGVSDTWATGFILSFISQNQIVQRFNKNTIQKAVNFLSELNGNWGYNKSWINDCDSTSFSLLALLMNGETNIGKYVQHWIHLQKESGGFSTYTNSHTLLSSLNQKDITSAHGWLSEHVCVSSVAFLLLSNTGSYHNEKQKLLKWLLLQQKNNRLFNSYWWTSDIYSTVFILKGLLLDKTNKSNDVLIDEIVSSLIKKQNKNGSFGDPFIKESPFYTGLVIDALCENKNIFSNHYQIIRKGISWLVNNQQSDGSWVSSYAMRIPHPDNITPDDTQDWPISTLGTQIRSDDYNRLFSTAVALSAICKYEGN